MFPDILNAIAFAAEKHKHQFRKVDGTPFINHCIGVAKILSDIGQTDVNLLVAAVLHDTVEDTDTTLNEIRLHFGDIVAKLVAEVTDDRSLLPSQRKKKQVESVADKSRAAKYIKLADKVHNLESMFTDGIPPNWDLMRVRGYFLWNKQITDQLKGLHPSLDQRLCKVYERDITLDGKVYPVIPLSDKAGILSTYYQLVDQTDKVRQSVCK